MFLDEFKVLDMSDLIAVNGGYGSSSYSSTSSSSKTSSSSGYSSTTSAKSTTTSNPSTSYPSTTSMTDTTKQGKKLIISVDQPGSGGDDDIFEYTGGQNFETGHAFVTLIDTDTGESKTVGFYPDYSNNDKPIEVLLNNSVPGKVLDDSDYDKSKIDVTKEFILTDEQYNAAIQYLETIEKFTPEYNLSDYNCTDLVLNTAASAGLNLPDTTGSWLTGSGSNPAYLGEDLRNLNTVYAADSSIIICGEGI